MKFWGYWRISSSHWQYRCYSRNLIQLRDFKSPESRAGADQRGCCCCCSLFIKYMNKYKNLQYPLSILSKFNLKGLSSDISNFVWLSPFLTGPHHGPVVCPAGDPLLLRLPETVLRGLHGAGSNPSYIEELQNLFAFKFTLKQWN